MHPSQVRRHIMQGLLQLLIWALVSLGAGLAAPVRAQGVDLPTLQVHRAEGVLELDFVARVNLPRAVEDAMKCCVTIYFVADAQLFRNRWYWRDERIARVQRSWRITYQPLTSNWRVNWLVGLGGLNQTYATLSDALNGASRSAGWPLADMSQIDTDKSYYVEFTYRLDTSQLPGPMQFGLGGLGGLGGQSDWTVGVSRVLKVDFSP